MPAMPEFFSSDSYMRLESEIKMKLFDEIEKLNPKTPDGESRVRLVVPSKNGFHMVTRPFDTREWKRIRNSVLSIERKYGSEIDLELKKDAMINLIFP